MSLPLLSQAFFLALSSLVALLELPQPTAPQVLPGDKQAALVGHHAALARGVIVVIVVVVVVMMVIGAEEEVLPAGLDLGALASYILGVNPQQLVTTADAVLALLVDGDYVDCELPPLACFVPFQDVHLDRWRRRRQRTLLSIAGI